jgi:membrane protein
MANILILFKRISYFLNHNLWRLRIDKLTKKQGFLLKQIRIFFLAIKGFNDDKCILKATALTYYTLFSIVPVIALAFAIAKGFDYQETLKQIISLKFSDQKDILNQAFLYADKMLANTKGGLIAGVGIILLLWSIIKLLSSIENSFNDIWGIKRDRTWTRKITDYLSIMLIGPIFIIISGGLTIWLKTSLNDVASNVELITPIQIVFLKLFSFSLIWAMFVFLYMALPNTKVTFKVSAFGSLIAAILFELLQWAYVSSQIGVAQYNKIYGSFAALPLFLIWIQYTWFVVLYGAELTSATQNVEHYELENDINNISDRYKRVIALMIANQVVKNFTEGKTALTSHEIATKLDLPLRLAKLIINEFIETGVLNEVKILNDTETGYQPAISDAKLTVKFIIDKLDEKGVNQLPIDDSKELATVNSLMKDMDEVLNTTKGNMLVKDLF